MIVTYFVLGAGSHGGLALYSLVSYSVLVAIAVGILVLRPADPRPWLLFGAGQLLMAVGDTIWNWYAWVGAEVPYPGVADWSYLAAYPFLTLGVLALMRGWGRPRIGDLLDGAIVVVVAALFAWIVLIEPVVTAGGQSVFAIAAGVGMPVGDVLLLGAVAQVGFRRFRRCRLISMRFLMSGVVLLLISDTIYSIQSVRGTYDGAQLLDAGWLVSYALWSLAVMHPSMREVCTAPRVDEVDDSIGRTMMLAGALVTGPALILVSSMRGGGNAMEIGIATLAIAGLVGARLLLISRERQRVSAALGESESRFRELFQEAHQASVKLADRNEELRDVDRMKDDLIALVSHELRTPLTSILGYLELVLSGDDGALNDEQQQHLGIVERSGHRLLRVVSDLLFVAQAQAGRLTLDRRSSELEPLVRESVDAAAATAAARQIALTFDAGETPPVDADPQRLAQVVENLVSNALKFSEPGGHVAVRLHRVGDQVAIEVADDGMGIPPDAQQKLFSRFFRTDEAMKSAIQGTGLGLSIVKAIVDAHGGEIVVESQSGVGSTFQVLLPAAAA